MGIAVALAGHGIRCLGCIPGRRMQQVQAAVPAIGAGKGPVCDGLQKLVMAKALSWLSLRADITGAR